ncbi:MAG: ATP-binding protein, partial [Bacteroidota bacterium]|nr:ATP-binding protein [Bacteroidota bacterium]
RKHAEEELLKLSHAVKQSTIATILINFRGETEYANPKTLEISGYSLEEVIGKNVQVFSFAKMEKDVYKELWETITSGKEWQGELLNMKKDGSAYWVSASIAPIYNDKKEIINYLAMAEEITEKKKMINELITAKEKAEGMNRLKSNFLANMSHELRTPLTGILGYAEILSSSLNDQEYREMSRSIHSCGKRLSETLNLILDLSKSETDKSEIPIKDINLEIVTKGIANLFTETARSKGIQLETIVREKNVIAKLNETLFSRVISILLDNAVKFTKSGAITIEVGREKNSEKEWSYVKIKDTGVGIPKDKMGIIWEEFRQVSEGLNRSFEGTGLGLTMAKRITELMDGVISVESEAGEGSIFTTKFPASTSTMEIKEIAKENDIAESIQSKKQKEERSQPLVLYVEDDSINRHVVSLYLKNICKVDTVQDGKAALEFVEKKHYDIILMDINLGIGMDGMAVTHEIRKMPEYANTPIVAVTAYAMEKEKEEFLAGGCTHFLAKPFSKGDIIQLVSGVVNN